ncbi:MAG: ABC transporter substrate-binding protein [Bifidobacteriaceae bacterium]|jgi:oligopeptide transport system substrate-binding protein|nr:ABC transporter substrate-binding protein [Bifidobacteriaceae bacterium]
MKRFYLIFALLSLVVTSSVVFTACSGGQYSSKIIKVYGCEPQQTLIPGNTQETCGGNVIDAIFSGLVAYNKDGSVKNEVAESIVPDSSNKVYTITLKKDWKFSDGEVVDADSFINPWNFTALSTNAQANQAFFEIIEGFDEVSSENPKTKTMSGLQKVDDFTFKVILKEASVTFPLRLGYSAFYPVPNSKFNSNGDLDLSYGDKPISNGPYVVDNWERDQLISLRKNPAYNGTYKPKNEGVDYVIYTGGAEAAYSDVQSGNLDLLEQLPQSQIMSFKSDSQVTSFSESSPLFRSIQIAGNLDHFGFDEEGQLRRQAISLSINRPDIISKIFGDSAALPVGYVPNNKLISGSREKIDGNEILQYNPELANEKWQQADKIRKFENPKLDIYYNADSGEKAFFEALANSIKVNLKIESATKSEPDKKSLLNLEQKHEVKGAYRAIWQPDYPSIENYLAPIYGTAAIKNGANYSVFSNSEFDSLLYEAATSATIDQANEKYIEAESMLFKYLPSIPTYVPEISAVGSKDIKGVEFNWKAIPDYTSLYK